MKKESIKSSEPVNMWWYIARWDEGCRWNEDCQGAAFKELRLSWLSGSAAWNHKSREAGKEVRQKFEGAFQEPLSFQQISPAIVYVLCPDFPHFSFIT